MSLTAIEHSPRAHRLDLAFHGAGVLAMAAALVSPAAPGLAGSLVGVLAGVAAWGPLEYALHRWVLHALPPFKHWHAEHHRRPGALIAAPTLLSAGLLVALVALPAWALAGAWRACAFTLGVSAAYLAYGVIHHRSHRPRQQAHGEDTCDRRADAGSAASRQLRRLVDRCDGSFWLRRQRRWHGHHHRGGGVSHFGVSLRLRDRVFGSAVPLPVPVPPTLPQHLPQPLLPPFAPGTGSSAPRARPPPLRAAPTPARARPHSPHERSSP